MKKTILTTAMMITIAMTTAFANGNEKIDQRAKESFKSNFSTTQTVSWKKEGSLMKATFTMNAQVMNAYYNDNAELVAVTRNILSDQLPIALLTDLKKNYSNFWVSDLFEIAAQGQTSYYMTLENADETLVLQSDDFNTWSVYKKTKRA